MKEKKSEWWERSTEVDRASRMAFLEELENARSQSILQLKAIEDIYQYEEENEKRALEDRNELERREEEMKRMESTIQSIEYPRDESMDNNICVLMSESFDTSGGGGRNMPGSSSSSHSGSKGDDPICRVAKRLEDAGMSIRRCATPEEAVEKARELLLSGQLRCVVSDMGSESAPSCPSNGCEMIIGGTDEYRHYSCNGCKRGFHGERWFCSKCRTDYCFTCRPIGGVSRKTTNSESEYDPHLALIQDLRDHHSDFALIQQQEQKKRIATRANATSNVWQGHEGVIPVDRVAMLDTNYRLTEKERYVCWNEQIMVLSSSEELTDWCTKQEDWPKNEVELDAGAKKEEEKSDDQGASKSGKSLLLRQASLSSSKLKILREELLVLQKETSDFAAEMESKDRLAHKELARRNQMFVDLVERRKRTLQEARETLRNLLVSAGHPMPLEIEVDLSGGDLPESLVRRSAEVLAMIKRSTSSINEVDKLLAGMETLSMESRALEHMELAAKVLALVPLHQKKLLNFGHDWLCTFLPHCMAKVNRVSFGLLTELECRQAVKAEPNMPRSRLKLFDKTIITRTIK